MNIRPSLLATRSIAAEFTQRIYFPVVVTFFITAVLLLAVSIFLVTISTWWVILLVLLSVGIVLVTAALGIAGFIIKRLAPARSKSQKQLTKSLVDKLLRVAEVSGTPKFILLFRVIKDVLVPSDHAYVVGLSNDTMSLKRDFVALKDSFLSE